MKRVVRIFSIVLLIASAGGLIGAYVHTSHAADRVQATDHLLLLVPDGVSDTDPMVQMWRDAGSELGLHIEPIRDSEFVNPTSQVVCAGLIVPDQIHREANDAVIGALYRFANSGGHLMLVYDAGTWDLQGRYVPLESRLSALAGVHYALYSQFGKDSILWSDASGTAQAMQDLDLPPGKYIPVAHRDDPVTWKPVSAKNKNDEYTFSRYQLGGLQYPSFRTTGKYDGKVLLQSQAGLVAGYRRQGPGGVLFVNLPLGYLKDRTDGVLMHAFLHYFAISVLDLPYLTSVPDGVGGIVLNWHLDARSALQPLSVLDKIGMFKQGPYSIHITAGPDVDKVGDGKGLDVLHDRQIQDWIHLFVQRGYEVGSHGGWIHNYFGENVSDKNEKDFQHYLEDNKDALEKIAGKPVREYSAPVGNHPRWVTHWLEKKHFAAYYFVGDAGMAPTRVYLDGERDSIWAFPVMHMGRQASFEEMQFANVPESIAQDWLLSVTDYVVHAHVTRLVYSHPFGAARYVHALQAWLARTASLEAKNQFRWYTMASLADFLTRREQVKWQIQPTQYGDVMLVASHPQSLAQFTWALPLSRYGQVKVLQGKTDIRTADGYRLITAKDGKQLKVEIEVKGAPRTAEIAP